MMGEPESVDHVTSKPTGALYRDDLIAIAAAAFGAFLAYWALRLGFYCLWALFDGATATAILLFVIAAIPGLPAYALLRRFAPKAGRGLQVIVADPSSVPKALREAAAPPTNSTSLDDVRARSKALKVGIEPHIDASQLIAENASSSGAQGAGAALGQMIAIVAGHSLKGGNWAIRALAVIEDDLVMYESPGRTRREKAEELVRSGDALLIPRWTVPLLEVSDVVEVGTARDHLPNVRPQVAERCDDIFFMDRGRRMLLGRYFDQVRDVVTQHQYEVREFIQAAKKSAKAKSATSSTDASQDTRASRAQKGFDL